jgi:hypothetical protein
VIIKKPADLLNLGRLHGNVLKSPISSSPSYTMGWNEGLNEKHASLCTALIQREDLDYLMSVRLERHSPDVMTSTIPRYRLFRPRSVVPEEMINESVTPLPIPQVSELCRCRSECCSTRGSHSEADH